MFQERIGDIGKYKLKEFVILQRRFLFTGQDDRTPSSIILEVGIPLSI